MGLLKKITESVKNDGLLATAKKAVTKVKAFNKTVKSAAKTAVIKKVNQFKSTPIGQKAVKAVQSISKKIDTIKAKVETNKQSRRQNPEQNKAPKQGLLKSLFKGGAVRRNDTGIGKSIYKGGGLKQIYQDAVNLNSGEGNENDSAENTGDGEKKTFGQKIKEGLSGLKTLYEECEIEIDLDFSGLKADATSWAEETKKEVNGFLEKSGIGEALDDWSAEIEVHLERGKNILNSRGNGVETSFDWLSSLVENGSGIKGSLSDNGYPSTVTGYEDGKEHNMTESEYNVQQTKINNDLALKKAELSDYEELMNDLAFSGYAYDDYDAYADYHAVLEKYKAIKEEIKEINLNLEDLEDEYNLSRLHTDQLIENQKTFWGIPYGSWGNVPDNGCGAVLVHNVINSLGINSYFDDTYQSLNDNSKLNLFGVLGTRINAVKNKLEEYGLDVEKSFNVSQAAQAAQIEESLDNSDATGVVYFYMNGWIPGAHYQMLERDGNGGIETHNPNISYSDASDYVNKVNSIFSFVYSIDK